MRLSFLCVNVSTRMRSYDTLQGCFKSSEAPLSGSEGTVMLWHLYSLLLGHAALVRHGPPSDNKTWGGCPSPEHQEGGMLTSISLSSGVGHTTHTLAPFTLSHTVA